MLSWQNICKVSVLPQGHFSRFESWCSCMKILIVNQHPRDVLGGSQIQCDLIATYLTRSGHKVLYLAVNGKCSSYATPYEVEPICLGFHTLHGVLTRYQPDIVYWRFNRRKLLQAVLVCKWHKVKIVFAIASETDVMRWFHRDRFDQLTWRDILRKLPALLRQFFTMRLQYVGYYGIDGVIAQLDQQTGKLPIRTEVVIYNSVENAVCPFQWNKPFVVWVGNFKGFKHPELFVELARQCQNLEVDFLMVGKMSEEYEQKFRQMTLPGNLRLLGPKSYCEVNGMLQHARCLVHTSSVDGFSNVLIQSWMQATPTISLWYDPDNMAARHQIGMVSGTFEQLIKDTKTLLNNEQLRHNMGQRAQLFAQAHFSPEENIRKLEQFLKAICEESHRTD